MHDPPSPPTATQRRTVADTAATPSSQPSHSHAAAPCGALLYLDHRCLVKLVIIWLEASGGTRRTSTSRCTCVPSSSSSASRKTTPRLWAGEGPSFCQLQHFEETTLCWVVYTIIMEEERPKRVGMMEAVATASASVDVRNFSAASAISGGLVYASIERLWKTIRELIIKSKFQYRALDTLLDEQLCRLSARRRSIRPPDRPDHDIAVLRKDVIVETSYWHGPARRRVNREETHPHQLNMSVQFMESCIEPDAGHQRLLTHCAMCALYLLSTLHIVLAFTWAAITDTADYAIYEVFSLKQPLPVLSRPGDPPVVHALAILIKTLWVVSNGIADALLIHRLYIIWGGNPRAVALPVVSYSLTMISAVVDLLLLPPAATRSALIVAMSSVFLTNVLSSALTAGRIWFMSRSCKRVVGTKRRARYTELMVIILESGLIYPALLVITIAVFVAPTTPTVAVLSCFAVLYHIVGIAPTLIIVRVSSGVNDDVEVGPFPRSLPLPTDNTSRLTTLHFAVPETSNLNLCSANLVLKRFNIRELFVSSRERKY
uniref:Ras-GEF domain-containing protein n=1 Tax=Mycena chlorophos TaxID=658473 RepID=A0ABQ0LTG2_MYCCL|nr:predicted protein [Mycena chlorophos]